MAGHDDGGNFFSDDSLDDLAPTDLEQLENNAIQFTQGAVHVKGPPSSDYGDDFDDDLDDAVVIDEARSSPAVLPALQRNNAGQATPVQFRQQRFGTVGHPSEPGNKPQRQEPAPPIFRRPSRPPSPFHQNTPIQIQHSIQIADGSHEKLEDLQKQIEELLKERNALKQDLNAKAGEIAIVRSKQEKTAKEFQREMNAVKKQHADAAAKQQKALEAARIAEKNAATERDFIKQDLAEESERVRRLNKAREAERKEVAGSVTTPKKKTLPHRDGFDDDEIEFISPSKISPSKFHKRIVGSPSKLAGKRKRKAADSPATALEVIHVEKPPIDEVPQPEIPLLNVAIQDDRFDFLGTMIDHRPYQGHPRTVEELGKHCLPSSPKESLSSIIFGKIPTMGVKKPTSNLPVDFCELLISLWSNCMAETYLTPVYLFIDMLTFALELKTLSIAPHIIDTLVPLVQRTGDLVAIPRFNSKPADPFDKHINVSACLALLHIAALGCMSEIEHITHFWKLMRWDFVLLILSQNQPTADFEMMLHILSTSVLKDSFGTISSDEAIQSPNVGYIIDRLSYPLFAIPCLPMSMAKLESDLLLKLRLQILQLLIGMTRSTYAGLALAKHPNAIGRIVSLMSDELDALYDYKSGHEGSALLITLATRLLYHLVTKYEQVVNLQKKLSAVPGGPQKYLLCLARLNFSEDDLVLESGIDPDVAGYALELLELAVTPEEGDAIHSAFSSS